MNNLREHREKKGVTMTSVALTAGVNLAALSRFERGATCNQRTAQRIAVALGENVRDLWPNFDALRKW